MAEDLGLQQVRELRTRFLQTDPDAIAAESDILNFGEAALHDSALISFYGLSVAESGAQGVQLTYRSLVEGMPDVRAEATALQISQSLQEFERVNLQGETLEGPMVEYYELFCGTGNVAFHLLDLVPSIQVHASELTYPVFKATAANFEKLGRLQDGRFCLENCSYTDLLSRRHSDSAARLEVYFVDPPWGDALTIEGLDLNKTSPSFFEIVGQVTSLRSNAYRWIILKLIDLVEQQAVEQLCRGAKLLKVFQLPPNIPARPAPMIYVFEYAPSSD